MKVKKGIRLALSILLLVITLRLLNLLSGEINKETLRDYRSIEEIKTLLDDIIIPSYFPESLRWPPSTLLASKRPYRTVIMEFKDREGNLFLVITESEKENLRISSLSLTEKLETVQYKIKGRNILLITGMCNEERCSELSWKEGRYNVHIIIKSGPFELLKIAESMITP